MGFLNKQRKEDDLIPVLFGELSKTQLHAVFPELAEAESKNQSDIVGQILLERTGSEDSRVQLLAWKELKRIGILPDESIARKVLGYVIEVGMAKGVDYLAVYADNSARYYNFSGSKIIYETMDNKEINSGIQKIILSGETIVSRIGVWDDARRGPPDDGMARINFLTPKGLFFGEGPLDALGNDELAKDVIDHSIIVMKLLMALTTGD